ncbi:hypothetical protein JT739_10920, partial [Tepidanaerobacter sp. GT38]|uniref:hypothetical protein n=1 Tax=Tepidanaerobacter sp. GT38 TaxID=2722793 RepID=UPI001F407390
FCQPTSYRVSRYGSTFLLSHLILQLTRFFLVKIDIVFIKYSMKKTVESLCKLGFAKVIKKLLNSYQNFGQSAYTTF